MKYRYENGFNYFTRLYSIIRKKPTYHLFLIDNPTISPKNGYSRKRSYTKLKHTSLSRKYNPFKLQSSYTNAYTKLRKNRRTALYIVTQLLVMTIKNYRKFIIDNNLFEKQQQLKFKKIIRPTHVRKTI